MKLTFLLGACVATAHAGPCVGPCRAIAGYMPGSDVSEHLKIDLDLNKLASSMKLGTVAGYTAAGDVYARGEHSSKSRGKRTLQGFSTQALALMRGQAAFSTFWSYHGGRDQDASYANTFVQAAIQGTVAAGSPVARKELAVKGVAYQAVWMYVLRELEDAVADCRAGLLTANDDRVHAWDEAWAFYTGSQEGEAVGGQAAGNAGFMPYRLAEKRAGDFRTRHASRVSEVNHRLLGLFEAGRDELVEGDCQEAEELMAQIKAQMTIPLVQGALRYAFLADPAAQLQSPPGPKEFAEGWAFASAVLPQVAVCSRDAAALIERNMKYGAQGPMADGHKAVFAAFEQTYACLGITCADIGGLTTDGAPPMCKDAAGRAGADARARIAGYLPGSDVEQHARIDLDVLGMATFLSVQDYTHAKAIYSAGQHSRKSSGLRSLRGLSDNQDKLKGEALADLYAQYWGSYSYAHEFITAALDGVGFAAGAADSARREIAIKGVQYQAVWMYVLHELEDAVADCRAANLAQNDAGVHAWDEGWAFYAGSLEGPSSRGNGQLLHALADKRCRDFGTCTLGGQSSVNARLLALFSSGERSLANGQCEQAAQIISQIQPLMTIPLVQGALRYAYKADPEAPGSGTAKERAEGWAFAAAVLPQVARASPAAADVIRRNLEFNATTPVVDGYLAVFRAFQSTYPSLGITCKDVGGLVLDGPVPTSSAWSYLPGTAPCGQSMSGGAADGLGWDPQVGPASTGTTDKAEQGDTHTNALWALLVLNLALTAGLLLHRASIWLRGHHRVKSGHKHMPVANGGMVSVNSCNIELE